MTSPLRLVLVDDHALFRAGLRELLAREPGFKVVAEGATGEEAVRLATELRPDVLLLDVEMPGPGPVRTLEQLGRRAPGTSVVVLTMHEDAVLVNECLRLGASAYLTKAAGRDELVAAVRAVSVAPGTVFLSVQRATFVRIDRAGTAATLSQRELDVLRLLAQAMSNGQIATELFISVGTVKRHLTNLYAKLGAVSRVDALLKATAAKLL